MQEGREVLWVVPCSLVSVGASEGLATTAMRMPLACTADSTSLASGKGNTSSVKRCLRVMYDATRNTTCVGSTVQTLGARLQYHYMTYAVPGHKTSSASTTTS